MIHSDHPGPDDVLAARGVMNGDVESSSTRKEQAEKGEKPCQTHESLRKRHPTAGSLRRLPRVAMVQTTDLGERNDLAAAGRFHGPGIRRILSEGKVRPGNVVVAEIAS